MPADLSTLLRDAVRDPSHELDLDGIATKARRRTRGRRALTGGAAAFVVAMVVLASSLRDEPVVPPSVLSLGPIHAYSPRGFDERVVLGAPVGFEVTGSLFAIDVASGRTSLRDHDVPLWPGDFPDPMLVVSGRLVWADLAHVWSAPMDLGDDPLRIATGRYLVPATDPDAVWVVREDRSIARIDVDGAAEVEGELPADSWPVAEVDGGVLLEQGGLVVWNPRSGAQRRVTTNSGVWAVSATVAYLGAGRFVDLRDGSQWYINIGQEVADVAAFSPDGAYLAVWTGRPQSRSAGVRIIDVHARREVQFNRLQSVEHIVGTHPLVWSPDSDAVYLLVNDGGDGSADRLIGIARGGPAQTIATIHATGWYWLAVGQPSKS